LVYISLSLNKLSCSPALEFEEGIEGVGDGGHECKKGQGRQGRGVLVLGAVDGAVDSHGDVEEGPKGAKSHFDDCPGDDMEFFHEVEEVHDDEDGGDPESRHRDKVGPLHRRCRPPEVARRHPAYEYDDVQQHADKFDDSWDGLEVGGVEPDVGLDVRLRDGGRRGRLTTYLPHLLHYCTCNLYSSFFFFFFGFSRQFMINTQNCTQLCSVKLLLPVRT